MRAPCSVFRQLVRHKSVSSQPIDGLRAGRRPLHCESLALIVLTRPFPMTFLVAAFRSPQVPAPPSPSRTVKTRKDTLGQSSWGLSADRYPDPIGRLSQREANGAGSLLATITFLGQPADTSAPERRALMAGQTTERQCSIRRGALDLSCCLQLCPRVNDPIGTVSLWHLPHAGTHTAC